MAGAMRKQGTVEYFFHRFILHILTGHLLHVRHSFRCSEHAGEQDNSACPPAAFSVVERHVETSKCTMYQTGRRAGIRVKLDTGMEEER